MSSSSSSSRRSWQEELKVMMPNLRHLDLSGQVFFDSPALQAHGGYCDVFVGGLIRQGLLVCRIAIKRLRVHILSDRNFEKVRYRSRVVD